MTVRPFFAALTCIAILLFASACDDPASAGLDAIGEQGGEPTVLTLPARSAEQVSLSRVTGNQSRVLAGRVEDPLFGTIAAAGYVDFVISASDRPDAFDESALSEATLELSRDAYLYGDTTSTLRMNLRAMPEEWPSDSVRADTTLEAGPLITEFSFSPTDTLVQIPLPSSWLAENGDILRSAESDFNTSFHGFLLEPTQSTRAVAGFERDPSRLLLIAGGDTARYTVEKTLSTLSRSSEADVPSNRLIVQNGVGPRARFDINLDTLDVKALNRAVARLFADTQTMEQRRPAGFARPRLNAFVLYGVTESGEEIQLSIGELSEGRLVFSSNALRNNLQRILSGTELFSHYRLAPPPVVTLNPMLFYGTAPQATCPQGATAEASTSCAPAMLLTLTPTGS